MMSKLVVSVSDHSMSSHHFILTIRIMMMQLAHTVTSFARRLTYCVVFNTVSYVMYNFKVFVSNQETEKTPD